MKLWISGRRFTGWPIQLLLSIPRGSSDDPSEIPQFHHLLEHLILKLRLKPSGTSFAQWLDEHGIPVNAKTSCDSITLAVSISATAQSAITEMLDILLNATVGTSEINIACQEIESELSAMTMNMPSLVQLSAESIFWGTKSNIKVNRIRVLDKIDPINIVNYLHKLLLSSTLLIDSSSTGPLVEALKQWCSNHPQKGQIPLPQSMTRKTSSAIQRLSNTEAFQNRPPQLTSLLIGNTNTLNQLSRFALVILASILSRGVRQGLLWEDSSIAASARYHLMAWTEVIALGHFLAIDWIPSSREDHLQKIIAAKVANSLNDSDQLNRHFKIVKSQMSVSLRQMSSAPGSKFLRAAARELRLGSFFDRDQAYADFESLTVDDVSKCLRSLLQARTVFVEGSTRSLEYFNSLKDIICPLD